VGGVEEKESAGYEQERGDLHEETWLPYFPGLLTLDACALTMGQKNTEYIYIMKLHSKFGAPNFWWPGAAAPLAPVMGRPCLD
jgi:hypothetical protein